MPCAAERVLGQVLNGGRVIDGVERAVLVEADLRALDPGQGDGVLGVVLRAIERVHAAAGLVQVGACGLRLVGVLAVQPAALERVHLSRAGMIVDWQGATRCQGGQEHPLSVFGVHAQYLEVNARGDSVPEQRDLVDVDGHKVILRQSDQRQWDAATELRGRRCFSELRGRRFCGHVSGLRIEGDTYLRI